MAIPQEVVVLVNRVDDPVASGEHVFDIPSVADFPAVEFRVL
jgi:hypothetical protein